MFRKQFRPIWMYIERFYENEKIDFFRILEHFWSLAVVWALRFPHGCTLGFYSLLMHLQFENYSITIVFAHHAGRLKGGFQPEDFLWRIFIPTIWKNEDFSKKSNFLWKNIQFKVIYSNQFWCDINTLRISRGCRIWWKMWFWKHWWRALQRTRW